MYNIFVVDDEELIREKISYIVRNSNILFNISEAEDGQEALDFIKNGMVPNIIITDVRMPVLSGLDLIKEVRQLYQEVKFVIISGYAEFEYALKAMQFGVTDYILKPVKSIELLDVVQKLINEIDWSKDKKEAAIQAESMIIENKRMLFEKKFFSLLTSQENEDGRHSNPVDEFNDMKCNFYSVSVVYVHKTVEQGKHDMQYTKEKGNDIYAIIQNCTQGSQYIWLIENLNRKNSYIIICGTECRSEADNRIRTVSERVFSKLHNTLNFPLTIGVSDVNGNMRSAYKSALSASKRRFLSGINNTFYYNEKLANTGKTAESFAFRSKLVEKSMENTDLLSIKKILMSFVEEVFVKRVSEYMKEVSFDYIFIESINVILRLGLKYNVNINEIKDPDIMSSKILESMDDIKDILLFFDSFIDDIISNCMESILQKPDNCHQNVYIMDKIIHYINQNINDAITLNSVSERFLINPSYLSRIFKETMGCGFVQYVTDLKIENAKQLLQNSRFDIADIAASLGYSDQQYFNRVFKRSTGLTPNEYRKSM